MQEYGGSSTIPPASCARVFEGCRSGSSCWTCLSLCCDACREFYRRSDVASKAPTDCPINKLWLASDLPPTKFEVPPPPPNTSAPTLETRAATTAPASTATVAVVEETAPPTTALITTTPPPIECGNSVRRTASSQCISPSFGGILVCDNATLSREIAEGTLRLGSEESAARYHVLEECDDGNSMSGDGCSGDCVAGCVAGRTAATAATARLCSIIATCRPWSMSRAVQTCKIINPSTVLVKTNVG